jgi:hypothetical protein
MAEDKTQEFGQEQATVAHGTGGQESAQTVFIHQATADVVQAKGDVVIRQGAAKEVRAQTVTIRQGAVVTVDADEVQVSQGGIGLLRANEARLGPGCTSAAIIADSVNLDQAASQFMLVRDSVEMDQSAAGVVVAQRVIAKDSTALLMFANSVDGEMRVVMDRQSAMTFGAAFGAALGIVLAIFGVLRRKGRS